MESDDVLNDMVHLPKATSSMKTPFQQNLLPMSSILQNTKSQNATTSVRNL